ncbi:hypothetical protein DY000_02052161 [Brassica cretica]|uniref:Uncharacterized protein n=1 Tax=Brassica cretica TaxID=69181 RepID=A0ABQ7AKP4_BRACR|nr:hypothetical protein DY000_02052161 [Brassica cretica]
MLYFFLKVFSSLLQNEKAFLKQPKLEEILEGNRYVKGGNRYWKNIVDLPLFVSLRSSIFHSCACRIRRTGVQTNEEVAIKLESVKTAQHQDI